MRLQDQRLNKHLVCGALSPADETTAEPNGHLTNRTEPIPTEPDRTESDRSELHRTDHQITADVAAAMFARVKNVTLVFCLFQERQSPLARCKQLAPASSIGSFVFLGVL